MDSAEKRRAGLQFAKRANAKRRSRNRLSTLIDAGAVHQKS